jgi:hypothetical protein
MTPTSATVVHASAMDSQGSSPSSKTATAGPATSRRAGRPVRVADQGLTDARLRPDARGAFMIG